MPLELDIAAAGAHHSGGLLPLILQTLVGNAIRHKVVSAARPLRIAIETTAGEVRVRNTRQKRLVCMPRQQESLTTAQARYQQLAGASALEVAADEGSFTGAINNHFYYCTRDALLRAA